MALKKTITLLVVILTLTCQVLFGQNNINSDEDSTVIRTSPITKAVPFIDFPNINEVPYYYHKKKLATVNEKSRSSDPMEYYESLFEYISHFGVQNFYNDTKMIWELGQLAGVGDLLVGGIQGQVREHQPRRLIDGIVRAMTVVQVRRLKLIGNATNKLFNAGCFSGIRCHS